MKQEQQIIAPNDGGPAFPCPDDYSQDGSPLYGPKNLQGMTLRDWFAAHETIAEFDFPDASLGMIAEKLAGPKPDGGWSQSPIEMFEWEATWRSKIKFIRADAMLAARERKEPS